ncbi:glycine cleavage system protein GcvH [Lacticigenium naphthae]|uniref:glycine cleavage system protein GcvH n=1 Tax=Lacticigenium naphthae TaxID=515351 RepID=UPI000408CB6E|nr:glycine cleavage system protein GcvH [Lacticigenium naphthae]
MTDKKVCLFSKDHEWVELIEEDHVRVGISDYAVEQLGDIVFVELPEVDSEVLKEAEFGTVESVKSSSEVYSPVSGTVAKVNSELEDKPELLNEDAFAQGWLMEVKTPGPFSKADLMTYDEYETYIENL